MKINYLTFLNVPGSRVEPLVEIAMQKGSWAILDEVKELIIPKDLSKAVRIYTGPEKYFLLLNKSKQKYLLQWIVLARQPHTRQKRIYEFDLCASEEKMPKHLQ